MKAQKTKSVRYHLFLTRYENELSSRLAKRWCGRALQQLANSIAKKSGARHTDVQESAAAVWDRSGGGGSGVRLAGAALCLASSVGWACAEARRAERRVVRRILF